MIGHRGEMWGCSGLSWPIVFRASGYHPLLTFPTRTLNTQGRVSVRKQKPDAAKIGASTTAYPNSWPGKVQMLFEWDDGIARKWDELPFRKRAMYIYDQLRPQSPRLAEYWRRGIGQAITDYEWLLMIPYFLRDKIYVADTRDYSSNLRDPERRPGIVSRTIPRHKPIKWLIAEPKSYRQDETDGQTRLHPSDDWQLAKSPSKGVLGAFRRHNQMSALQSQPFDAIKAVMNAQMPDEMSTTQNHGDGERDELPSTLLDELNHGFGSTSED